MLTSKLLQSRFFLIALALATVVGIGWLWVEQRFRESNKAEMGDGIRIRSRR